MPEISVIVPMYNSRGTIERCLNSILNQTFGDIELIVVDDASTDGCTELVRRIAERDGRVNLVRIAHGGVSAARNTGLRLARGRYIQFVDSDDDILPDMLQKLRRMLVTHCADAAVCNFTHPCLQQYLGDAVLDLSDPDDMLRYVQNTFAVTLPWNKLYLRQVITEYFDEEEGFFEDGLFGLANMFNMKKIVSTSEVLYHYYCAPPQASADGASCINSIAKAENFWETKDTFWYKLHALKPKIEKILAANTTPLHDEVLYARMFDFMPWEFVIFAATGVDGSGVDKEIRSIFHQPDFLRSVTYRSKYGITLRNMSSSELDEAAGEFVRKVLAAVRVCLSSGLKVGDVVMGIFIRDFVEVCGELDATDLLVRLLISLENNNTPEARFVNSLSSCRTASSRLFA